MIYRTWANPSIFFASGVWVKGKIGAGAGTYSKDGGGNARMQDEIFEHIVSRAWEILSPNLFASSERHISEVLTHIDLLERTVRFPSQLANIVTDKTVKRPKSLKSGVF